MPVDQVIEIMRVLPLEALPGAPSFIRGLSVIRGSVAPVVDVGLLLGGEAVQARRLVTIAIGGRTIALSVESVLGVSALEAVVPESLPPLLRDAGSEIISAIGNLDRGLLLFLRTACIVPDALLHSLPEVASL